MRESDLMKIKKRLEDARSDVDRLNGKLEGVMDTLKNVWGCQTVEEAVDMANELETKRVNLQAKIDNGLEKLEAMYDFN